MTGPLPHHVHKLVRPGDLNSANNLFGGRLLEWIDEECGVFALLALKAPRVVTKLISQVDFKAPAVQGQIIDIGVDVVRYGTSSIVLSVEVLNTATGATMLTIDQFVLVCVDEHGRPRPHGVKGPV